MDEEELTRRKQVDKHFHYRVLLALVTSLIVGLEDTLGFAEIPKKERLSRALAVLQRVIGSGALEDVPAKPTPRANRKTQRLPTFGTRQLGFRV